MFYLLLSVGVVWCLCIIYVLSVDSSAEPIEILFSPVLVFLSFWPQIRILLCIAVAIGAVATCTMVRAQTVGTDPAYANMQRAIGGIIQSAGASRGYVPSDPRTYKTMYRVGGKIVAGVAAAGSAILIGGTAPAWGTALAMAALSAGVYYAVDIGIDALVKWAFNEDGSIDMTASGIGLSSTALNGSVQSWASSHPLPEGQFYSFSSSPFSCTPSPIGHSTCCSHQPTEPGQYYVSLGVNGYGCTNWNGSFYDGSLVSTANGICPGGGSSTGWATCTPPSEMQTIAYPGIDQASSALTSANLSEQVSPQVLALLVNEYWRQAAAEPGYDGIPYPAGNPVTTSEVQTWMAANPGSVPTVQSLVTPVANPATDLVPSTSTQPSSPVTPVTSTTPPTATNPAEDQPEVNLGVDPNIGPPGLEATPSAQMILQPLLSLLPDMKSYSVPGHTGDCPKPVFQVFDTSITMDQHCTLFEQHRALMYAAGLLAFALAALFIVLSA